MSTKLCANAAGFERYDICEKTTKDKYHYDEMVHCQFDPIGFGQHVQTNQKQNKEATLGLVVIGR